ncbi:322_t:CDS:2 [Funneliformis geosporum]|uniref:7982_t:CDS:1 n=1 Tax=Funneliformis geosporum TaxID=1117311 RepID=A0A9W4WTV3_9GLOM|nr:7982_t:CDS:2 [Funneliformis geosporum]CAI2186732.1 322_t:CDS:2 [Funneliformis geosporum]
MSSQEELVDSLSFDKKSLHDIFKTAWKNPKTKIRKEALALSVEYLRIFTVQAVIRATNEAQDEVGGSLIRLEVNHLEKVIV